MIATAAMCALALALAMLLVRLFVGPTLHDRAMATRAVIAHAGLLCAAAAALTGSRVGAELALALYLCSVVTAVATLKFFRARTFQPPIAQKVES
jgi:multicomponent Na+:H+ antiporter subunit F